MRCPLDFKPPSWANNSSLYKYKSNMNVRGKSSRHVKTPTTPLLPRTSSRHSIFPRSIPGPLTRPLSRTARRCLANIPIILAIFIVVFFMVQWSQLLFDEPIPTGPPWHGPPFLLPVNVAELLGPYSPYFPAAVYERLGGACNITQV